MVDDAATVAGVYFDAWRAKDFDRFRSILAEDMQFSGPLGEVTGADECTAAMRRLAAITTDIVVRRQWVDGPDVITWFELHTRLTSPKPVANWAHVLDGKVQRIRVTFDPRGLAPS